MPSGRNSERKESLHLRVDAGVLRGVDAVAVAWGVSRNEAANRLLDEAVGLHIAEVVDAMQDMVRRYQEGRFEPPDLGVGGESGRVDKQAG